MMKLPNFLTSLLPNPETQTKDRVNLKKLKIDANRVIKKLEDEKDKGDQLLKDMIVNWADLFCLQAQQWRDDRGNEGFQIVVSEASPSEYKLAARLQQELAELGWENVLVQLEW